MGISRVGTGMNKRLGEEGYRTFGVLQLARLDLFPSSLWAASTVRAAGAVVVGTEVHDLATEGAAVVDQGLVVLDGVVDEGLVLLDGHLEKWLEIFGTRGDGGGKRRDVCLCL